MVLLYTFLHSPLFCNTIKGAFVCLSVCLNDVKLSPEILQNRGIGNEQVCSTTSGSTTKLGNIPIDIRSLLTIQDLMTIGQ